MVLLRLICNWNCNTACACSAPSAISTFRAFRFSSRWSSAVWSFWFRHKPNSSLNRKHRCVKHKAPQLLPVHCCRNKRRPMTKTRRPKPMVNPMNWYVSEWFRFVSFQKSAYWIFACAWMGFCILKFFIAHNWTEKLWNTKENHFSNIFQSFFHPCVLWEFNIANDLLLIKWHLLIMASFG